jgi:hypothetical protein
MYLQSIIENAGLPGKRKPRHWRGFAGRISLRLLHEYVRRGVPNEKADRLRWLNITCTLAALTEQHTIPLYRWVSQHVDDCEDCRK